MAIDNAAIRAIAELNRAKTQNSIELAKVTREPALISATAGAKLDNARAQLLPGQVAAEIAKLGADTFLATETGKTIAPESRSRIKNLDANTLLTGAQRSLTNAQTSGELQLQKQFSPAASAPEFFARARQQYLGY